MRFKRILVAAGLRLSMGFALALASTGCTSPVDTSADDVVTAQGKLLAFSYDASLDQFTHMSCSNMPYTSSSSYNTSAYFTYRMGAYNQAGVTLNDAFYSTLKKYKFQMQSEILSASPANTSTVPQFAMRGRLDYQNLFAKIPSSPAANQDYWNMLTDLGAADTTLTLVNNPAGGRIKQIRNGSPGGYRMEGSLYFTDTFTLNQQTRNFLSGVGNSSGNAGVLALTFSNGTTQARSVANTVTGSTVNASKSVFGRGYIPTFSLPAANGLSAGYPANVVTAMSEMSLDGSVLSPTPIWSCPSSMQLRIVRAADLGKAGANCVRKSDPNPLTADLKLLRNTLKVEDWYIDLADRCIIPKGTGLDCYGTRTDIVYTMSDPCSADPTTGFSNCTQYASTCYRTN